MKGKFAFWMRSYTKSYSGLIKVYLVGEENGVLVLGDQMGDNATIGKNLMGEDDWSVKLQAGGAKVASKSGRDLEKGESRVVKFAYTAPASGPVALTAVIVSDKDQVAANNSTAEFTIQVVPGGIKGDVDVDGEVDTNDLNAVINALVGKGSASNTDVDGDGTTDVSDVNALINLVLGKGM